MKILAFSGLEIGAEQGAAQRYSTFSRPRIIIQLNQWVRRRGAETSNTHRSKQQNKRTNKLPQQVDLAGSERVHKTRTGGQTLVEAKHINVSLFFLEMVIVALHERGTKGR